LKKLIKYLSAVTLLALTFSNVNAAVIYNFDVSDVSWSVNTPSTPGDFSNSSLWFEFTDTADLNALLDSDLLRMGFNTGAVEHTFSEASTNSIEINDIFGINGSVASLTVGSGDNAGVWCSRECGGFRMQVGRGNSSSLLIEGPSLASSAHNSVINHTYYSSVTQVPEPTTASLLLLGIASLGFARRQKKS
jgi:hypothetical protein